MASPPLEGRESKLPLSLGCGFHSRVVSEKEVMIKNIHCQADSPFAWSGETYLGSMEVPTWRQWCTSHHHPWGGIRWCRVEESEFSSSFSFNESTLHFCSISGGHVGRSNETLIAQAAKAVLVKMKVKSLSHVRLFATPWTVAHQASLSVGFSR